MPTSIKKALAVLLMLLVPTLGLEAGRVKIKIGKVKGRVPKKVQAKRAQRKFNQKVKAKANRIRKANAARKTKPKITKPVVTKPVATTAAATTTVAKPKASAWTVKDGTAKVRGADGVLRKVAPTKVNGKNAAFVPEGGKVKSTWRVKGDVVKQRLKDGSVMHVSPNGIRTRVYPSGRRITILPDGTAVSVNALGQRIVRLPSGKMVVPAKPVSAFPKLPKAPGKVTPAPVPPVVKPPSRIKGRHVVAGAVGAGLLLWPTQIGEEDFDQFGPPAPPPEDGGDDEIPGLDPDDGDDGTPVRPNPGDQDQTRRDQDRTRRDQDPTDHKPIVIEQKDDEIPGFDNLIIQETVVVKERRVTRNRQDQDQDSRH